MTTSPEIWQRVLYILDDGRKWQKEAYSCKDGYSILGALGVVLDNDPKLFTKKSAIKRYNNVLNELLQIICPDNPHLTEYPVSLLIDWNDHPYQNWGTVKEVLESLAAAQ